MTSLIWICTVCICYFVRNVIVKIFWTFTVMRSAHIFIPPTCKSSEPAQNKTYYNTCATSRDSDQPAYLCSLMSVFGVVGWCEGAVYLTSLGRPTDTHHWGVQLILAYSWARPAILVVGKGRGGMFLFLLFLHFHSCSSFFPVSLFHLLYSLFYLFSPFLWETTQNDPQGLTCR